MTPSTADVLVTGAGGFLGGNLLQCVLQKDLRVRAAVRKIPRNTLQKVDYVEGDLADPAYADMLMENVDTVFHVAAATRGSLEEMQRGTVISTQNVIDACLKHHPRRLVYVSSLSVLDHAVRRPGKMDEQWPLEPHPELRGAYTQTKLLAEQIVTKAVHTQGLPAVIIRPGAIFGPGASQAIPAGSFGVAGRWIVIGNGSLPLPLIYVDDVVDGLVLAAWTPDLEGMIIHLVDPHAVTQRQFITAVQAARPEVHVSYIPKSLAKVVALCVDMTGRTLKRPTPLSPYRLQSLQPLTNFDQTLAEHRLAWKPVVGVVEGLRRTFTA